jgi:phosphatidylglycerophosphate synthase
VSSQITVMGLACTTASFILVVVIYNPTLSAEGSEQVPAWVAYFAGAALLVYQTLDNMDGKQARRLKMASPLGLIVDHGCDALQGGVFGPLTAIALVGSGTNTWQTTAMFIITTTPFFINTYESYHTGKFILPPVNGPSEGLVLISLLFLSTGYLRPSTWHQPLQDSHQQRITEALQLVGAPSEWASGLCYLDLVVLFFVSVAIITVSMQLWNVFSQEVTWGFATSKEADPTDSHHATNGDRMEAPSGGAGAALTRVVHAINRLLPIVAVEILAVLLYVYGQDLLNKQPSLALAALGLAFTDITVRVMIAHVGMTEPSKLHSWMDVLVAAVPVVMEVVSTLGLPGAAWATKERTYLWLLVSSGWLASNVLLTGSTIARQLSTATGIPVWTVPERFQVAKTD